MSYSPLAIHCTSLLCDILQGAQFQHLSHQGIDFLYEDIYELIQHRTEIYGYKYDRDHKFVDSVTRGVLKALHICKDKPTSRDAKWLLLAMQSRINFTIKQLH